MMLHAATLYLEARVRQRGALLPVGVTWPLLIVSDLLVIACGAIATFQRPYTDLPVALTAFAISISPILSFAFANRKFSPVALGAAWLVATALFLFATSTPIQADFAPSLLVLMVVTVRSLNSTVGGLLAFLSAFTLIIGADAAHRLDNAALYVGLLVAGVVAGYAFRAQRLIVARHIEAQRDLAERAAAGERGRVGLPEHPAARRAHIAGAAPEPGFDDIGVLVEDFEQDGLAVTLSIEGYPQHVTPQSGLALYLVTKEVLGNITHYAPRSTSTVALDISAESARLAINTNATDLTEVTYPDTCEGYRMRAGRRRVESIGGAIEFGPTHDGWSVCVEIPLQECADGWSPWWRA